MNGWEGGGEQGGLGGMSAYKFARDAKEVESPQVAGMLPDRLLLCSAMVDRLAKQLVVPQVEGRLPLSPLPCRDKPCKDCSTPRASDLDILDRLTFKMHRAAAGETEAFSAPIEADESSPNRCWNGPNFACYSCSCSCLFL